MNNMKRFIDSNLRGAGYFRWIHDAKSRCPYRTIRLCNLDCNVFEKQVSQTTNIVLIGILEPI